MVLKTRWFELDSYLSEFVNKNKISRDKIQTIIKYNNAFLLFTGNKNV